MLLSPPCHNPWIRNGVVVETLRQVRCEVKKSKNMCGRGTKPRKFVCCTEAVWFRAGDEHEESRSLTIERQCSVELRSTATRQRCRPCDCGNLRNRSEPPPFLPPDHA